MITIDIPLRPVPQRDSARGRFHNYLTKKQISQQAAFEAYLRPFDRIEYPVFVYYDLRFRIPKATSASAAEAMLRGQTLRTQTPDRVNCEDFLDNRLKNTLIIDDAFIISGGSIKRWAKADGVTVYIQRCHGTHELPQFLFLVSKSMLGG